MILISSLPELDHQHSNCNPALHFEKGQHFLKISHISCKRKQLSQLIYVMGRFGGWILFPCICLKSTSYLPSDTFRRNLEWKYTVWWEQLKHLQRRVFDWFVLISLWYEETIRDVLHFQALWDQDFVGCYRKNRKLF